MRLTLRTLLAYLDDTLDPAQASQIGAKVAESDVAMELMERIRKVTRKRNLGVPPTTGPERADANTVAEYLDNDLSDEKIEEVEKQALLSEVHLAEIAACHQLLTLILSEPAKVPPTARQRMYRLVKGSEVDPSRRAPRVGSATINPEVALPYESDSSPLVSRRGGGKRMAVAAVLTVLFVIAVWQIFIRADRSTTPFTSGELAVNTAKEPDRPAETTNLVEKPKENVVPQEPDKPKDEPKEIEKPPMPKEVDQPKVADKPPVVPPPPLPDLSVERKTSDDRKVIGKFVAPNGVLLQSVHTGAPWQHVATGGSITGAARLMSLPGIQSEVRLSDAVQLDLWGTPVEYLAMQSAMPMLESVAGVFVPPAGFDADVRLERGRIYLRSLKPNGAKVRLRLGNDLLDLTFADDQSELMANVYSVYNGELVNKDPALGQMPVATGEIAVIRGAIQLHANRTSVLTLTAAPGVPSVNWNSKSGLADALMEFKEPMPQWAKQPSLKGPARERTGELNEFAKRYVRTLADPKKALSLAIDELAIDRSPWAKPLAAYCQAALDYLPPLLDTLDDSQSPADARIASIYALQQWLAYDPGNDARLHAALMKQKSFSEAQADLAVEFLHGADAEALKQPATYARAIECLVHDRLALCELAAWQLNVLDPEAHIAYQATDPLDRRQRAYQDWKRRIPEGTLPPGRAR